MINVVSVKQDFRVNTVQGRSCYLVDDNNPGQNIATKTQPDSPDYTCAPWVSSIVSVPGDTAQPSSINTICSRLCGKEQNVLPPVNHLSEIINSGAGESLDTLPPPVVASINRRVSPSSSPVAPCSSYWPLSSPSLSWPRPTLRVRSVLTPPTMGRWSTSRTSSPAAPPDSGSQCVPLSQREPVWMSLKVSARSH